MHIIVKYNVLHKNIVLLCICTEENMFRWPIFKEIIQQMPKYKQVSFFYMNHIFFGYSCLFLVHAK